jgi:hypothetical protein
VKRSDEVRHLRRGPDPGERPRRSGTLLPAVITARGPAATIERARSVLLALLTAPHGWSTARPPGNLPGWFVDACAPDPRDRADDIDERLEIGEQPLSPERARAGSSAAWTLAGWLDWFEDERYWFWWDARVTAEQELVAEYVVYDWPAPLGSLIWLWRASGATDVAVF